MIEVSPIAHIHTVFPEKFGIPRQSGLVNSLPAEIIMEPEYRVPDAFRGIEGFSHLWLIWQFSENAGRTWSPTVRPPRLGGNVRKGVFATRSPFRPNYLGLSCVKIAGYRIDPEKGPVLTVTGADLMDGTPILDIKPYVPDADAHPEADGGFAATHQDYHIDVRIPEELQSRLPESLREGLIQVLREDPRPAYHRDPGRIYGMSFAGFTVKFRVEDGTAVVTDIIPGACPGK